MIFSKEVYVLGKNALANGGTQRIRTPDAATAVDMYARLNAVTELGGPNLSGPAFSFANLGPQSPPTWAPRVIEFKSATGDQYAIASQQGIYLDSWTWLHPGKPSYNWGPGVEEGAKLWSDEVGEPDKFARGALYKHDRSSVSFYLNCTPEFNAPKVPAGSFSDYGLSDQAVDEQWGAGFTYCGGFGQASIAENPKDFEPWKGEQVVEGVGEWRICGGLLLHPEPGKSEVEIVNLGEFRISSHFRPLATDYNDPESEPKKKKSHLYIDSAYLDAPSLTLFSGSGGISVLAGRTPDQAELAAAQQIVFSATDDVAGGAPQKVFELSRAGKLGPSVAKFYGTIKTPIPPVFIVGVLDVSDPSASFVLPVFEVGGPGLPPDGVPGVSLALQVNPTGAGSPVLYVNAANPLDMGPSQWKTWALEKL